MSKAESWHIPELGQSLGLGYDRGGTVLTATGDLPPGILMFNGGVRPMDGQGVIPSARSVDQQLSEEQVATLCPAQERSHGPHFHETHLSALAAQLCKSDCGAPARYVISAHGVGNTGYARLQRGTAPYDNLLRAVAAHTRLSAQAGLSPVVPFVSMVHGESDSAVAQPVYAGFLNSLRADLQKDIAAITGQPRAPFLAVTQIGKIRQGRVSDVALAQLAFGCVEEDGLCAGPKYQWAFSDKVHLTSKSYRHLGEMIGKFCALRLAGHAALPLHLRAAERVRPRLLRLQFHVPVQPLRLRQDGPVRDPGACGIEVLRHRNRWQPVEIENVSTQGPTDLILRLAQPVQRFDVQVRIAMQKASEQGPQVGPRSVLSDSDTTRGALSGAALSNWCAHGAVNLAAVDVLKTQAGSP